MDELTAYDPFATAAEFAAYARRGLDEFDAATVEQASAAASDEIRKACEWQVWPQLVDDTLVIDGHGGRTIMLPVSRVTAVTSLTLHWRPPADDTVIDETAYDWYRHGRIELLGSRFPHRPRAATVVLTHGFAVKPRDLVLLTCQLIGRTFVGALPVGRQQAGAVSISGPTPRPDGTLPSVDLTPSDKLRLKGYRGGYR